MSICWVGEEREGNIFVTESETEEIEAVRIEQPLDYVQEKKNLTWLGGAICAASAAGVIWLLYCVAVRVVN